MELTITSMTPADRLYAYNQSSQLEGQTGCIGHAGIDPKTVQYLAGHENSKTTMDIYAQVKYNKPEELLSVVNAAFAPSVGV